MSEALGIGISIADLFFIVPVAAVIQGIPIAPAGWGIGEAAYGTLIGKFGASALPGIPDAEQVMRTRGVALSVLHRVHVALVADRRHCHAGGPKSHPDESPMNETKNI